MVELIEHDGFSSWASLVEEEVEGFI